MKALQATCIVGAIVGAMAFTGMIDPVGGSPLAAAGSEAAVSANTNANTPSANTAGMAALSSVAVLEASAGSGTAPAAELGSVTAGSSLTAQTAIGGDPDVTASVDSRAVESRSVVPGLHDPVQPVAITGDASADASDQARVTPDFRYLIYYVWSELPPAEKPAAIVLRALKDIPVGTPVEEIRRASNAFGLDFNFMKAVARIESGFDPRQRTGSYYGLFQLSKYEFSKYGSGEILDPRDNAVAAAYKVITEGILFEWVTHRTPTLSDLYLIHQQGWEGAAEHISQPDRIAWKSMCATSEGVEKGEKWCKRAIWRNTLPAVKDTWKSVDRLTSGAFVGMWRGRVAEFMSKYMATAAANAAAANTATAAAERTNP